MSGSMVEFPVNGTSAGGYLAAPDDGSGPGVLVLQEWWGLVPQIKGVCDQLAGEGFVALAPDLYGGEFAEHTEMDKAGELMTTLPPDRAARDMSGAIDHLLGHGAVTGEAVGVVGFCMGGMLALMIAALEGDRVAAAAPFYGAPLGEDGPDWSSLTAKVEGHFAAVDDFFPPAALEGDRVAAAAPFYGAPLGREQFDMDWSGLSAKVEGHFAAVDDFFPPDAVEALGEKLRSMGKDVEFHVYAGAGHAFANWENPLGTHDEAAAAIAWGCTLDLFRGCL